MKRVCFLSLLITLAVSVQGFAQQSNDIYKDSDASIEERVKNLLSQMTLKEKIGQMTQLNITLINTTGVQKDVVLDEGKARMYLKEHHIGSFLNGEAVPAEQWYDYIMGLQKIAVEETRLGIPIIYGIDHMHGASYLQNATIFPHNINLAATFTPEYAKQTGRITAIESADLGHHWNFAPVLDLGQNPSWARLYETFGESPYVVSTMGKAYVDGLINNEEMAPYKIAATGKHFLGYSVPKSGWDRTPVDLSDQTIHEFHLPPFQGAIDAGMQTIMVNSSEINGIPVHASKEILTDLLRDKLDFEGVIVTDWDDIGKLVNYHYTARNYTEATEMVINAGVDMSMTPLSLAFNESLLELVENGRISEERINESVRRILRLKFELGLFENPYPRNDRFHRIGSAEHKAIAKAAADESIVLLKNENEVLPISKDVQKILVVGPTAHSKPELAGGWTIGWQGGEPERYPEEMHTVFTALEAEFNNSEFTILPFDASESKLRTEAQNHDLIITVIGEEPYTEFIGNITSLELPKDQQSLIKVVAEAQKPVVGVFIGGRPRIVANVIDDMDAYLWAGLPGFLGADAIADIISGDVNPSAKLPISYPIYEGHFVPYNHKSSDVYFFNPEEANSITQGEKNVWQWPYGYGLSYTDYSYSNLTLSDTTLTATEELEASITVTNTGERAGKEAVIWYIKDHVGTITRPVKEVKHFEKISLKPGESQNVSFVISASHLGFPDFDGSVKLEHGVFSVMVGNQRMNFTLKETQLSESN